MLKPKSPTALLIFTRYPTPGKTKTRLIPALGAQGAAQLQEQLTEWMVAAGRSLQEFMPVEIVICGSGEAIPAFQIWLGAKLSYQLQQGNTLGDRLIQGFESVWQQDFQQATVVGIDCPSITPALLLQAFEHLNTQDIVIGPAADGGYYLFGCKSVTFKSDYFQDITWGTGQVYRQTLAKLEHHQQTMAVLEPLNDIDRPEDLSALPESFHIDIENQINNDC